MTRLTRLPTVQLEADPSHPSASTSLGFFSTNKGSKNGDYYVIIFSSFLK